MIDLGTLFVTQHLNESGRPSYMTRKAIVRDTLQWSQWIVLFIQLVRWIRCKCLWKNGAPPDGQQAQSAVASVLALLSPIHMDSLDFNLLFPDKHCHHVVQCVHERQRFDVWATSTKSIYGHDFGLQTDNLLGTPSDITASLSFILMWPFTAQIHLEVSGLPDSLCDHDAFSDESMNAL